MIAPSSAALNPGSVTVGTGTTTIVAAQPTPAAVDTTQSHQVVGVGRLTYVAPASPTTLSCGGVNGWQAAGSISLGANASTTLILFASGSMAAGVTASPIGAMTCSATVAGGTVAPNAASAVEWYETFSTMQ